MQGAWRRVLYVALYELIAIGVVTLALGLLTEHGWCCCMARTWLMPNCWA